MDMVKHDGPAEHEGVIQYQLEFSQQPLPERIQIDALEQWRRVLHRLQLIGQSPQRYGGLGYGNLSQRLPQPQSGFLVTASQTGELPELQRRHYAWVQEWDVQRNRLCALGELPPSSEALTHAMLYEINPTVGAVVHVHSPEIWCNTEILELPHTPAHVGYGTPAMALSVARLVEQNQLQRAVFAMLGHEDGVMAFGATLEAATMNLLAVHAQAMALPTVH